MLDRISDKLTEDERVELYKRAEVHDMDKVLLYLYMDHDDAHVIHQSKAPHHMENSKHSGGKTIIDKIEALIDYECAGYTKADKPRNAYDTILDFKPNNSEDLLELCKRFDMHRHYLNTPDDAEWVVYRKNLVSASEESIKAEILKYLYQ